MARKRKNNESTNSTEEIVKKVKSLLVEVIVRDWINTPCKEWNGLTPLAMIRKGEGQQILDAIKKAEEEMKNERNPKQKKQDDKRSRDVEESVGQETILSRVEGS